MTMITSHTSRIIRHMSHVTRHTCSGGGLGGAGRGFKCLDALYVAHTSHVTRHTSHVTRHTSHVTCSSSSSRSGLAGAVDALPPPPLAPQSSCCMTRHTSHVTSHTSHVTHHTHFSHLFFHAGNSCFDLRITSHTSHVTCHTSHVTRHTCNTTNLFRRSALLQTLVKSL